MKYSIWKFQLDIKDDQCIAMPEGAHILRVALQNGFPHLWAYVRVENKPVYRRFIMHGTGHGANDVDVEEYVGSFDINMSVMPPLVFHVFDKGEVPTVNEEE